MFAQARPTSVVSGLLKHAAGSALVKQGETKVLCAMSIQIGQPSPEQPDHGDVWVSVSTSDHQRSDTIQAWLQRMLDDLLPSRLCFMTGKACMRIISTVLIMEDAGNILDASLLACMSAWKNTVLPTSDQLIESEGRLAWKDGPVSSVSDKKNNSEGNKTSHQQQKSSSTSREYKISLTMGVIQNEKGKTKFLVDPAWTEQQYSDAILTMVVNMSSRAIQMEYAGLIALTNTDIALAAKMANGRADELSKLL